jgi:hypothetical protein
MMCLLFMFIKEALASQELPNQDALDGLGEDDFGGSIAVTEALTVGTHIACLSNSM